MSATLGALIKQLQPDWSIEVFERLPELAEESSNPWNNAGTGHAALCELNYTPELPDGSVEAAKAVAINEQFMVSRQMWSYLVANNVLGDPKTFINPIPHMTFVWGKENVEYMRKRVDAMSKEPLFAGMEFTESSKEIAQWAPLLMEGRASGEKLAATRAETGTDVDYGSLTRQLFAYLEKNGARVHRDTRVTGLKKRRDGSWRVSFRHNVGNTPDQVNARFVFVGAGGGALHLLQKSRIPEIRGYGGFPISGEFLRTENPDIVSQHHAKVYGKASVGAPPMSVPHLDTRVVDGTPTLLFGPFAGFSPKFLKTGSWFDLIRSVRWHNLWPMIAVGLHNFDLLRYLIGELTASHAKKLDTLREFMPTAEFADWELITAGQRVQVMKKDEKLGGVLQFGTEVVSSSDGSIAGLLGASPGASVSVDIMLQVLQKCFPAEFTGWKTTIKKMVPSFGTRLNENPAQARETLKSTSKTLRLN